MPVQLSCVKMVGMIFLTSFVLLAKIRDVDTSSCFESAKTLSYVKSCPKSEAEWLQRESLFNCKQYKHTCNDFVYHCTFSEFANATLEVCAPAVSILGHRCMEYNIGGKIIQDGDGWKCSSCPFLYNSTNAYQYQECYEINHLSTTVHPPTVMSTIENNATYPYLRNASRSEGLCRDIRWNVVGIVSISLNVVFIPLGIVAIMYTFKHRSSLMQKRRSQSANENSNEGEGLPFITDSYRESGMKKDESAKPTHNIGESEENEYWVSAIDIGDKYCGMAYLNPESPKDIIAVGKVERIAVILSTDGAMLAFGDNAREMYISGSHGCRKCFYLDELKMDDEKVEIEKHTFTTIRIYQNIMNYLLGRIHGEIDKASHKSTKRRTEVLDIHYVVTVPNHWKRRLDKLEHAILGATIDDQNVTKEKLHIKLREVVLSPFIHEVKAAVMCLNFNIDNMTLKDNTTYALLHVGSNHCSLVFLHVDDSTQPDKIECEPYRKNWAELPEDRFLSIFEDIFTPTVFQKWMEKHHKEFISLMYQFEKQKIKMYQNTDDDEKFEFVLSSKLSDSCKQTIKYSQKDIEDEVRKTKGMEMKNDGKTFIISWSKLKSCFEDIMNETRDVVDKNKALFEQKNVHCVIMTGRYSQMRTVLNEAEKNWFRDIPVTVAIPITTGSTYAMGAAYFMKKFPNFASCQVLYSDQTSKL